MDGVLRLTVKVHSADQIPDGVATQFSIETGTIVIGRSPMADWTLPDSNSLISSRHCEISYADGAFQLTDQSTNGTFLSGSEERITGPYILREGDQIQIGHYRLVAQIERIDPATIAPAHGATTAAIFGAATPTPGTATGEAPSWHPAPALVSMKETWPPTPLPSPSEPPEPAAHGASTWGLADAAPDRSLGAGHGAADVWGKQSASYSVDWARGGFDVEPSAAMANAPSPPPPSPPVDPLAALRPAPRQDNGDALAQFLAAAGLEPAKFEGEGALTLEAGGRLLRRLIGGMVVMLEARARAKSQMGAQTTIFTREGNNPLKFARTPESALMQLLKQPIPGYMGADRAIEDSFRDLQLHQMATLKAMQGALRATLNRFSPDAIRLRAEKKGLLERIMPGAREAALWKAYEREFSGVAQGSDEAFMDVFAREFRRAYDEEAAKMDGTPSPAA